VPEKPQEAEESEGRKMIVETCSYDPLNATFVSNVTEKIIVKTVDGKVQLGEGVTHDEVILLLIQTYCETAERLRSSHQAFNLLGDLHEVSEKKAKARP
jgi:hypothetical protein